MRNPLNYQIPVLNWAIPRSHIGLGLEMRLGKTLIAIRWAEARGAQRICLVAPKAVLSTWYEELLEEGIASVIVAGSKKQREKAVMDAPADVRWYLTNYETLVEREHTDEKTVFGPSAYAQLPWDTIILDESTKIKNPKAQITQTCHWMRATNKAILSGRMNPESMMDYWAQMAFLGDGQFMGDKNFWKWRDRLFRQVRYDWRPKPGTIELIQAAVRERTYLLTRREAGVGLPKTYCRRMMELPSELHKRIKHAIEYMEVDGRELKHTVALTAYVARMCGGIDENGQVLHDHKLKELGELIGPGGELEGQKIVVWSRFNAEVDTVAKWAEKYWERTPAVIKGGVDYNDAAAIRNGLNSGKYDLLSIQTMSGLYGLNLSSASAAFYYSNAQSGGARVQSEDRLVHPLRKDSPLIGDLLCEDSYDIDVYELLKGKKLEGEVFNSRALNKLVQRYKVKGVGCATS